MTIQYNNDTVSLDDAISVEDAESLLEWVQAHPSPKVDFSACTHLHAADLQVLMAAGIAVVAWPSDLSLKSWLTAAFVN